MSAYLEVAIPGPVVGKGRPRFSRRSGTVYTPAATASAEARIGAILRAAWGLRPLLDEPLSVTVDVRVPIPASKSKRWRSEAIAGLHKPVGKPDLDNVLKLVGDAGNGTVWVDDSRIGAISIKRTYGEEPYMYMTVAPMA